MEEIDDGVSVVMANSSKTFRYIEVAIVTALGAIAEIYAVSFLLSGPLTWDFLVIMFLIPTAVYLFNYFEEPKRWRAKDIYESTIHKHIILTLFILGFAIGTLWFVSRYGNSAGLILASIIMIWGILYTILFKGLTHYLVGFKDYYVALGWNLIIPLYVLYYSLPLNAATVALMVFAFTRDLMNTSYYDLKDIAEDREKGLKTFATILGEKRLFMFLQLLNIIGVIIIALSALFDYLPAVSMLIIVPVLISSLDLFWSQSKRSYSALMIDFEYFIWAIVFFSYKIWQQLT